MMKTTAHKSAVISIYAILNAFIAFVIKQDIFHANQTQTTLKTNYKHYTNYTNTLSLITGWRLDFLSIARISATLRLSLMLNCSSPFLLASCCPSDFLSSALRSPMATDTPAEILFAPSFIALLRNLSPSLLEMVMLA